MFDYELCLVALAQACSEFNYGAEFRRRKTRQAMGFVMFLSVLAAVAVIIVAAVLLLAMCVRMLRYWQSDNVMVLWVQERIEYLADWLEDLEANATRPHGDEIDPDDMVRCESCNKWMSASANEPTWPECWNCYREH